MVGSTDGLMCLKPVHNTLLLLRKFAMVMPFVWSSMYSLINLGSGQIETCSCRPSIFLQYNVNSCIRSVLLWMSRNSHPFPHSGEQNTIFSYWNVSRSRSYETGTRVGSPEKGNPSIIQFFVIFRIVTMFGGGIVYARIGSEISISSFQCVSAAVGSKMYQNPDVMNIGRRMQDPISYTLNQAYRHG